MASSAPPPGTSSSTNGLQLAPAGGWTMPMRWIIALMTCIAMLGAALALWAVPAAAALNGEIAGRLSVQLIDPDAESRQAAVDRIAAALRAEPFVRAVTVVPQTELVGMAEQWLGDGVDDAGLPLPALIDVDLAGEADAAAVARATRLAQGIAPSARIIRHRDWLGPVAGLMASVGWIATLLALALIGGAAAISAMAARAALAAQAPTIEIFHLVGATDTQIARLFQRVIARQTIVGAAIGGLLALLLGVWLIWLGSGLMAGMAQSRGALPVLLALLVPVAVVVIAIVSARLALSRALRSAP
jgi:cell division transport system permease protein